jgi:hypothetical protein
MTREERDNKILDVLRKRGPMKFTQIKNKTGLLPATLARGIASLDEKLIHIGEYYALPKDLPKLIRMFGPKLPISLEVWKQHTEELKKDIITPWIEQLPFVSRWRVYRYIPGGAITEEENLEVEKRDFFKDFGKHLCFKPDPFKKWDLFKRKAKKLREGRNKALSKISIWVEDKDRIGMKVSDEWKEGRVSPFLPEWFLEAAFYLADEGKEAFDKNYLNFDSRVEPKGDRLEYWIGRHGLTVVSAQERDKDAFKSEMDGKIRKMMEEIENLKFSTEVNSMRKIVFELNKLREQIRKVLEKHLKKVVFPGYCEYMS